MNKLIEDISLETVKARHSVRSYTTQPISDEHKALLTEVIEACNAQGGLHMQLVTDEPNSYAKSFWAHYGKFRNVRNYICLVGSKADGTEEKLGYYGEIVVLKAQAMGLNTCWTGLSYSKKNTIFKIDDGEKLYALIAVGYGDNEGVEHKSKKAEQVSSSLGLAPKWYKDGIYCALLAPTAINQQKFHFELLLGNKVKATTGWGFYNEMDLGIAKLHFEIGVGNQEFEWC